MDQIVVYTAISSCEDRLQPVPEAWRQRARFVAFWDCPQPDLGWEIRPLSKRFRDLRRNASVHKCLPHVFFPEEEYSLWLEGSVSIVSEPPCREWIKRHLRKMDLATFKHRIRKCLYDEGFISLDFRYDSEQVIRKQMQKYCDLDYPESKGLAECVVLLRRHSRKVQRLNETWFNEVKQGSVLNQLSFDFVVHQLKLEYGLLPGTISNNRYFERHTHTGMGRSENFKFMPDKISLKTNKPARKHFPANHGNRPINMVFLYYDNPQMLEAQIDCWNSYPGVLENLPEVLLIDDGSPRIFAADIVQKKGCRIPVKVYRIWPDIPWNFAGARNLGCFHARNWIYVSDIDTLLQAPDARALFEQRRLNEECFYIPRRVYLPELKKAPAGIVNLLFHKSKYQEIGGYDEDYAGHYGKEETDYYERLGKVARQVVRKDVLIRVMTKDLVPDARTIGPRLRDKTYNTEIFMHKQSAGFPKPKNPLRFSWDRVL